MTSDELIAKRASELRVDESDLVRIVEGILASDPEGRKTLEEYGADSYEEAKECHHLVGYLGPYGEAAANVNLRAPELLAESINLGDVRQVRSPGKGIEAPDSYRMTASQRATDRRLMSLLDVLDIYQEDERRLEHPFRIQEVEGIKRDIEELRKVLREDNEYIWNVRKKQFGKETPTGYAPKSAFQDGPGFRQIERKAWEVLDNHFSGGSDVDYKEDIAIGLINNGFSEEHALAVANLFEDNLQSGSAVGVNSKNQAYYINGNKVVKFTTNKKEASFEALSNYHFSRHSMLSRHSSSTNQPKPLEIKVGDKSVYMTVQDVRADSPIPQTADRLRTYLHNWMKVLARFHVYGTQVMDQIGNHQKAASFGRECYEERLKSSSVNHDQALLADMLAGGIENGYGVAQLDTKRDNRKGYVLIDWGNGGRGNQLFDVVKMLSEDYIVDILGRQLNKGDYRELLSTYTKEKRSCIGNLDAKEQEFYAEVLNVNEDLDTTYQRFKLARGFMLSNIEAQLYAKGDPEEERTRQMIAEEVPSLQTTMRKSLVKNSKSLVTVDHPMPGTTREETKEAIIYYISNTSGLKAA